MKPTNYNKQGEKYPLLLEIEACGHVGTRPRKHGMSKYFCSRLCIAILADQGYGLDF
jgi:hypothetical protein